MKITSTFSKTIDKYGWGISLTPVIYFGWENYTYKKYIVISFIWLFWDFNMNIEFSK